VRRFISDISALFFISISFFTGGESSHINGATVFLATLPRTLAPITLQLSRTIVGNLSLLEEADPTCARYSGNTVAAGYFGCYHLYTVQQYRFAVLKVGHGTFLRQVRFLSMLH